MWRRANAYGGILEWRANAYGGVLRYLNPYNERGR